MATLKISHSYLADLRSEGKARVEDASSLNRLFHKEETSLKREDGASTLRAAYRTIVEQLQDLKRIEISASLGHSQANLVLFPVGLALTAISSKSNRQSAVLDYLRRGSEGRHWPFGTVMVCVGPKGLPQDAKAVSISQLARDSNRPEPQIVNRLQEDGYLVLNEKAFSSLTDKLVADVRQGKLRLPVSGEQLAEIVGLNRAKSRIKIVPIE
jgi:hypothetical protein